MDWKQLAVRRIAMVEERRVAERLNAKELLQQRDNLGVFLVDGRRNVERRGGRNRGILFGLVEAEFGIGLFAAARRFVEIGTVNFGNDGIVFVGAALAVSGAREGESVEFWLRQKTEVD